MVGMLGLGHRNMVGNWSEYNGNGSAYAGRGRNNWGQDRGGRPVNGQLR